LELIGTDLPIALGVVTLKYMVPDVEIEFPRSGVMFYCTRNKVVEDGILIYVAYL
jgi:hypothetical protein